MFLRFQNNENKFVSEFLGKNLKVGKIVLYLEESYKVKNQYLKTKRQGAGIMDFKSFDANIEFSKRFRRILRRNVIVLHKLVVEKKFFSMSQN